MRIAIDGPAGAGKSTVAKKLAQRLGYAYLDTGALYRALTLAALRAGFPEKPVDLIELVSHQKLCITSTPYHQQVLLNGEDVTEAIRTPAVSAAVSLVARVPEVRELVTQRIRELARGGKIVVEGRDIGTVVLPEAEKKFFLTAELEERARRRWCEICRRGFHLSWQEQLRQLAQRDHQDAEREVAPLQVASDALVIDTTSLSPDEVVEVILRHLEGKS
ncbi:(d)CMP kinase [Desulfothermobacter acidiphilus]|uniref:(d)CMP kinase n=1 Tax=Desulfothermobacter acidiphilus TaxID=1938353 RepID=UPI003F8A40C1